MPLKLNIGLSRKMGEANYGSRGASVNVELEVDSTLIDDPNRFHERVRRAFGLVRTALAEELTGGMATEAHIAPGSPPQNGNGNGNGVRNGSGNGQAKNGGNRPATQSQVKALHAIARNRRVDLSQFLNERFRIERPEDLSLREASQAIDALKADGQEGRRT
jgi:hypothetical protein